MRWATSLLGFFLFSFSCAAGEPGDGERTLQGICLDAYECVPATCGILDHDGWNACYSPCDEDCESGCIDWCAGEPDENACAWACIDTCFAQCVDACDAEFGYDDWFDCAPGCGDDSLEEGPARDASGWGWSVAVTETIAGPGYKETCEEHYP